MPQLKISLRMCTIRSHVYCDPLEAFIGSTVGINVGCGVGVSGYARIGAWGRPSAASREWASEPASRSAVGAPATRKPLAKV
jgi:hypothetical protein